MADDISYKASFEINLSDLKEGIKDVEARPVSSSALP
jgi:hypothetical protein